jgi:glycine oxidase
MLITIIGAGIAGLTAALELAKRGGKVELLERGTRLGLFACSSLAGGMISPWCEMDGSDPAIAEMGERSLSWWQESFLGLVRNGTLVVATARDSAELSRFSERTHHYRWLDENEIAELEPDLGKRFSKALFYPDEAHLDPKAAMQALADVLKLHDVNIRFGVNAQPKDIKSDWVIDCRGLAARDILPKLRGVRGEMIIVKTNDIKLSRPVRLLHPRFSLYVVPRGEGLFMLGATMLESESRARVSVRSALELLNTAYTLHPAFAEAEIIEMGADLRPAFADNVPRLVQEGNRLFINGFYRHGFLVAPIMAQQAVDIILGKTELGKSGFGKIGQDNEDLRKQRMA